jgi:hypothetical protein
LREKEGDKKSDGARTWVFADGFLSAKTQLGGRVEPHEALMILNTGETPANVRLHFHFDNKEPVKDIPVRVEPERVI